jgi:hypothetical protein
MTHWAEHYLAAPYVDGARGPVAYDCWGLVREVRHLHCGKSLLESWGHVRNDNPRDFTRAYEKESTQLRKCGPEHGAIASVFRGRICCHVAVVVEIDAQLMVLEMTAGIGARMMRVHDFERVYMKVTYHND